MTNKIYVFLCAVMVFLIACGGGKQQTNATNATPAPAAQPEATSTDGYDPKRGEGKFSEENVKIDATLNTSMADAGEKAAGVKCTSCHKMTEEKLVGPGWKGVTSRHTAHWIMNFITNPDPMLDKDPVLQAQLELCLVRMPNQSLADEEARSILEFMRKNDGVK